MQEPDFLKRFEKYLETDDPESIEQQYISDIFPFLNDVAGKLSAKYAPEKLYPHISNFGTHIMVRLGVDKKQTHRASIGITFEDDYIFSGFDLTHALKDARRLQSAFQEKTEEIAAAILKLEEYTFFMPNAGITEYIPVKDMGLEQLKTALLRYNPVAMRECYLRIMREYDGSTMEEEKLVGLFEQEHDTFAFLLSEVKVRL